jgi:hypothetical protein
MYGLIWEYLITREAFEVRLFGFVPIYRLKKESIVAAHLGHGLRALEFGSHPLNTITMGNRLRRDWVLLEKRWWPRFLGITPKDPEAFVGQIRALISGN